MKTTISIEEDISTPLAAAAQATGVEVNKLVNDLVRDALKKNPRLQQIVPKPFIQRTFDLGWHSGMTWERMQQILAEEEIETYQNTATHNR